MTNTTPMHNPETNQNADVHPAEVDNWKSHGWREVTAQSAAIVPPPPPPPGEPAARETLRLPNKK